MQNNAYELTEVEIEAAYVASWRRSGYPPVREQLLVQLESHPTYGKQGDVIFQFVRLTAIPERLHSVIHKLSIGSACPSIDEDRNTFYIHDMERWLRAIGIQPTFIEP